MAVAQLCKPRHAGGGGGGGRAVPSHACPRSQATEDSTCPCCAGRRRGCTVHPMSGLTGPSNSPQERHTAILHGWERPRCR